MEGSRAFRLVMRRGPQPEKIFALSGDTVTLGRDVGNDIAVNDAEVSRQHTRLVLQAGGYVVEDLGSTNGTFVNDIRITGPTALSDGDIVGVGETVTLVYEAAALAAPDTILTPGAPAVAPPPAVAPAVAELGPPPAPEPLPLPPPIVVPEPEPLPPPPRPAEPEPVLRRAPTTARPITPPPHAPPAEEKPKNRKPLLIGCGCLVLLAVCAIISTGLWLLWNAPPEFYEDPIGNFDRLFGMVMPLLSIL